METVNHIAAVAARRIEHEFRGAEGNFARQAAAAAAAAAGNTAVESGRVSLGAEASQFTADASTERFGERETAFSQSRIDLRANSVPGDRVANRSTPKRGRSNAHSMTLCRTCLDASLLFAQESRRKNGNS